MFVTVHGNFNADRTRKNSIEHDDDVVGDTHNLSNDDGQQYHGPLELGAMAVRDDQQHGRGMPHARKLDRTAQRLPPETQQRMTLTHQRPKARGTVSLKVAGYIVFGGKG